MPTSLKKADSAGFCFGVSRAVDMVNELLDEGKKVCTLGPIIHNKEMVEELRRKGCRPIEHIDELGGDEVLVIRSHGVPKAVTDSVAARGLNYRDATCPFVKKIHRIVSQTDPEKDIVLIAGNSSHPEVQGIIGNCACPYFTFNREAELDEILPIIHKRIKKICKKDKKTMYKCKNI